MTTMHVRSSVVSVWPIILLMVVFALPVMVAPGVSSLPSLPKTDHAIGSHSKQDWNATSIALAMSNGGCGPVSIFSCPDDKYIYTCKAPGKADRLLGLIVGKTSGKVVTGYIGSRVEWESDTDFCSGGGGPAYALP